MIEVLTKLKDGLIDVLLPKFCLGCGKEGQYICKNCEIFLSEVENGLTGSSQVVSVWEYEGLMEKLIYKIKFDKQYHIIDELVEKALEKIDLSLPDNTYITYVPMYRKRERDRGFNQSCLIAQKLGNVLSPAKHKPIAVLSLLAKTKDNRSQVGLGPKERIENVKNVFEFQGSLAPQNVLLVDDVYTTGATVRECVRVLRKAGVKNVWIFTLARKLSL
jgi:competence protein ComFC